MTLFLQLFKQFIFWLLFFFLNRLIFISYHFAQLKGIGFSEIISTFYHAFYLDVSTACYLIALPFFFIFFQSLKWEKLFSQLNRFYSFLMIIIVSVLVSTELGVYDEWGTKLNAKALTYLAQPSEIFHSATTGMLISGTIFILLQSVLGIYLYNKFIYSSNFSAKGEISPKGGQLLVFFILSPALLFLGIRGGWQPIPIHQSDVYFSKNNFLNDAAVNSAWNLLESINQNKRNLNKNPYSFFSNDEATKIVKEIFAVKKDTTEKIITTNRPNVVMIILEGWSADVIESLGGEKGIAPEFEKLISGGLLFTNCYATGERSEQGIAAVLSGFPAQATASIIGQPSKYPHLPCINAKFLETNYSTSFMFGGQLNYGNIKGYIYYNRFDKIIEGKDFPDNIPQQRLGVPDEYLFERNINEMKNEKEPFFSVLYTLSSHSPYDQPMEDVIETGGEHKKYLNSVFYSDRSLGEYFRNAKKQSWYKNTLFVIVSDHSHPAPAIRDFYEPAYKKIPLLFYGNVLKTEFQGTKNDHVISQIDIASTLLAQLEIKYDEYKWSKNFFNPYSPKFAYYTFFTDGFGWVEEISEKQNDTNIRNENFVVYLNDVKDIYLSKLVDEKQKSEMEHKGKAFMQEVFQEYLEY